jgi:hypothetical protein
MAGELLDLVERDQLGRVTTAVHRAIARSFDDDLAAAKNGRVVSYLTGAETRRRFDICIRIVKVCRGDLKWSVVRICDNLYRFLRAELDGQDWKPDARLIWTPS